MRRCRFAEHGLGNVERALDAPRLGRGAQLGVAGGELGRHVLPFERAPGALAVRAKDRSEPFGAVHPILQRDHTCIGAYQR